MGAQLNHCSHAYKAARDGKGKQNIMVTSSRLCSPVEILFQKLLRTFPCSLNITATPNFRKSVHSTGRVKGLHDTNTLWWTLLQNTTCPNIFFESSRYCLSPLLYSVWDDHKVLVECPMSVTTL